MQNRATQLLVVLLTVLVAGCATPVRVVIEPVPTAPSTVSPATAEPSATHIPTLHSSATPTPKPPTHTPDTPTLTPIPPAPTVPPVPPTAVALPLPALRRIEFAPGATSASRTGRLESGGIDRYVLNAQQGQTMEAVIVSPRGDVVLAILGSDGVPMLNYIEGKVRWSGSLHATQDYFVDVISVGGETDYSLTVWIGALASTIPRRIRFAPGSSSASLVDSIAARDVHRFVLRAFAGQEMGVTITSPRGDVLLSIIGDDGMPMKRYVDGEAVWQGKLHATQDYVVEAVSVGDATNYSLSVRISAPTEPRPERIQFPPGGTSGTVEGVLQPGLVDRYVLRALAGQRLEVYVSPADGVDIAVWGQDTSFWGAPHSDGSLIVDPLPATQDYTVVLGASTPGGLMSYRMTVHIPPL